MAGKLGKFGLSEVEILIKQFPKTVQNSPGNLPLLKQSTSQKMNGL